MKFVAKRNVAWYIKKRYYYTRAWTKEKVPKGRSIG
ncbi:hypothetical protein FITA111629_02175 [Filibacter tadaridae]|uniref:Uncharacterized protein n=1 Tax=Filibacter tadaridae TaxID=2483811 RepID=A0A3P5X607_9BACL|nr:hypothetical protein FILTAD_02281 [Filibacter tadaridae]